MNIPVTATIFISLLMFRGFMSLKYMFFIVWFRSKVDACLIRLPLANKLMALPEGEVPLRRNLLLLDSFTVKAELPDTPDSRRLGCEKCIQ